MKPDAWLNRGFDVAFFRLVLTDPVRVGGEGSETRARRPPSTHPWGLFINIPVAEGLRTLSPHSDLPIDNYSEDLFVAELKHCKKVSSLALRPRFG